MLALKLLSLFFLIESVLSEDELPVTPCPIDDGECFNKHSDEFLSNTTAGVPGYDVRPMDPMSLDTVSVSGGQYFMLHFKNITITGFKQMKINYYKLDSAAKSIEATIEENIDIAATVVMEFTDVPKTFTGPYNAKVHATENTKYNYEIETNDKGVEHVIIGAETVTCEILDEPEVTIGQELKAALENDADAKNRKDDYLAQGSETGKHAICKIIEAAFHEVLVHNIRAIAKVFPKSVVYPKA